MFVVSSLVISLWRYATCNYLLKEIYLAWKKICRLDKKAVHNYSKDTLENPLYVHIHGKLALKLIVYFRIMWGGGISNSSLCEEIDKIYVL